MILNYFFSFYKQNRHTKFDFFRNSLNTKSITFTFVTCNALFFFLLPIWKELCFFNNIAILEKFLKIFPSDKTILKSGAYHCYPTTTVNVVRVIPVVVVEGEHPAFATYETRIATIDPISVASAMPAYTTELPQHNP